MSTSLTPSPVPASERPEDVLRKYRALFENIPDSVFLMEAEGPDAGRILEANPAAEVLHGYGPGELTGRNIRSLDDPETARHVQPRLAALREQGHLRFEGWHVRKDGSRFPVEVSASLIRIGSRPCVIAVNRDTSDRQEAARLREEMTERFRAVASASNDGLWEVDFRHGSSWWSDSCYKVLGLQPSGAPPSAEQWRELLHPEDREGVSAEFSRAMAEGRPISRTYRIIRPDGAIRHIEDRAVPVFGADGSVARFVGGITDVTRRRQAEAALKEREALLSQAEQLANVGSWEWQTATNTMLWSDQLRSLVAMPADAMPRSFEEFVRHYIPLEEQARWLIQWDLCMRESTALVWEGSIRRPDGVTRRVRCRLQARQSDKGRPGSVVGILHDVTAWREAEESRMALEKQLMQIQKLDALGALAGGLAHEFNNILGAIMGNAEVAQMDLSGDHPSNVALDEVLKAARRARDLVRRVLTFSRGHEGPRARVALAQLIQESLTLLRASIPPEIEITRQLEPGLPDILADASQIHQVLINLATTGARAMKGGPGTLSLHLEKRVIGTADQLAPAQLPAGEYVVLTVGDTGPALPAEVLERLFSPFSPENHATDPGGLGLPVVSGIVRAHGGALEATSGPGRGTRFRVFLPAAPEAGPLDNAPDVTLPRGSGQRVLVVDDEPLVLDSMSRMIEKLGYQPTVASSPAAAIEAVAPAPNAFSALILDLGMPGMNGIELAHTLRDLGTVSPIILNTGLLAEEEARTLHHDSLHQFLSKPNTLQDLANVLKETIPNERNK